MQRSRGGSGSVEDLDPGSYVILENMLMQQVQIVHRGKAFDIDKQTESKRDKT